MAGRQIRKGDEALQLSVAAAWLETHASPNTRAAYRADLETFGRWCATAGSIPLRASATTLVAFQEAREAAGDSASTMRRRWSALSSFYEFAIDNDASPTNPTFGLFRPKTATGDPSPTRRLSTQAVDGYRELAEALDPRLDALVSLIVAGGLKVGEALALDIDDIRGKPPAASVVVRRRGVAKRVTLDGDTARAVRRCVGRRRAGPLFTRSRTASADEPQRLTRFGADHLIRKLTPGNEERVTANALRAFHLSASQRAGTDIDSVRDGAGLADVRSVRRYLTAADEASD